ncbi:hypothetical protein B9L23_12350 [Parageobacillus galactosidasius]|uniref:Uncharacterized protein n=1 Tax=Parageobacillus galactosidasius TaxID=883812 RepID=A0A226QHH2_9BACL|nr:hypothetical protein B9L23_12350 [Parageobacillus galactosidasius]
MGGNGEQSIEVQNDALNKNIYDEGKTVSHSNSQLFDVYLALAFDKETVFFCYRFQQHLFIFAEFLDKYCRCLKILTKYII